MKRRLLIGLAAACMLAALSVPASASAVHQPGSNCSLTGDYCIAVFPSDGGLTAVLRTFSFRGAYELCVRPPKESFDCRAFALRPKAHGIYEGRVSLARQFGPLSRGRYAIRWMSSGTAIGGTLHFRVS
jgi:hypothetical protein